MKLNLRNKHQSGLTQAINFTKIFIGAGVLLVFVHAYLKYGIDNMKIFTFWIEYINYYIHNIFIWLILSVSGSFVIYACFFIITGQEDEIQEALKRYPEFTKTITLKELSKIWISPEGRERIRKELEENDFNSKIDEKTGLLLQFVYEKKASNAFIDQYVKKYLLVIEFNALKIILELLKFLEENGGCSSVSGYKKDPESERFLLEFSGEKSSYDILGTFSLYDHTLRVVRHFLLLLEKTNLDDNIWQSKIGKALIMGLSHDIGKVRTNQNFERANISITLKNSLSHAVLSKMMFLSMFSEYENVDEIAEYIENHHTSRKDLGSIGIMLVNADKNARKEEKNLWTTDQNRIDEFQINDDESIIENCVFTAEMNRSDILDHKSIKKVDLDIFGINKKTLNPDINPIPFEFGKIESSFKEAIFRNLNTFLGNTFIPGCASVDNKIVINIELFKSTISDLLYIGDAHDVDGYIKHAITVLNSFQYSPIPNIDPNNPYLSRFSYSSKNDKRHDHHFFCIELNCEYIDMGMEMLIQHKKNSPLKNIILEKRD